MLMKAIGTLARSAAVAATRKRTMPTFRRPVSTTVSPIAGRIPVTIPRKATRPRARTIPRSGTTTLPAGVRWPQLRATTLTLLVHAAHDRVEAGHDRHRIGDQVAGHQHPHALQVDEARVVDAEAEGLVGPIADGVAGVLPAGALDGGEGAARAW